MSVSCQKNYSLTVTGIPGASAYWRMDELGNANRVDHILGLVVKNIANPGGNVTGVIANALQLVKQIGGTQFFGDIFNANGGPAWSALSFAAALGCSWSLWLKFESVPAATNNNYALDLTYQSAGGNIQAGVEVHAGAGLDAHIAIDVFKPPFGAVDSTIDLGTVTADVFHHLALAYDVPSNKLMTYLDSVLKDTRSPSTAWAAGTNAAMNLQNGGGYFNTDVDELGWWNNTVLSQTVVTSLFNAGAGQRPPNG